MHAGCSNAAIAAACSALISQAASSQLAVLKLGPPASGYIPPGSQGSSPQQIGSQGPSPQQQDDWNAEALASLEKLLQSLPKLQVGAAYPPSYIRKLEQGWCQCITAIHGRAAAFGEQLMHRSDPGS